MLSFFPMIMLGIVQRLEQKIAQQEAELKRQQVIAAQQEAELKRQQAQIEHLMGTCMKEAILL